MDESEFEACIAVWLLVTFYKVSLINNVLSEIDMKYFHSFQDREPSRRL